MKVRDPDGQVWRVSRRWVPWRRRLRTVDTGESLDWGNTSGDDPVSAVIAIFFLILALPFLLLVLLVALEFLLLLALVPFAALLRVAFGSHWTVEVRRGFTPWWETPAGRWGESAARIREVAAGLGEGRIPPRTLGEPEGDVPATRR